MKKETIEKISEHYSEAVVPSFDRMIDDYMGGQNTDLAVQAMKHEVDTIGYFVSCQEKDGMVKPETVLGLKVAEMHLEYAKGNLVGAAEKCYDAIAVLLHVVDVLEGRKEFVMPHEGGAR